MSLFHPFAFMLAQPEEDPEEIVAMLGAGAFADDKYDGVRAQIHASASKVRIYSRTLDDVTHRFPEIESAARAHESNGYWVANLLQAYSDVRQLSVPVRVISDLQSLTPADIRKVAQRWLVKERSLRMEVIPE